MRPFWLPRALLFTTGAFVLSLTLLGLSLLLDTGGDISGAQALTVASAIVSVAAAAGALVVLAFLTIAQLRAEDTTPESSIPPAATSQAAAAAVDPPASSADPLPTEGQRHAD